MKSKLWLTFLCLICLILDSGSNTLAVSECQPNQFQCVNGDCLPLFKKCNGLYDCSDDSDELQCDKEVCLKPNWFPCSEVTNQPCLSSDLVCNGYENCPTGVDELYCNNTDSKQHKTYRNCSQFEFVCATDSQCIPRNFVCDGKQDCRDGSDESDACIDAESKCNGYLCDNKHCIDSKLWLCDTIDDCGDGSDEKNCSELCTFENKKFLCEEDFTCIALDKVCDGHNDCVDGSDEIFHCSKSTNCSSIKCPSSARCYVLPRGQPKCLCPDGFRYSPVANACVDINECMEQYDLCSQQCSNVPGSFQCSCARGYTLNSDNRSCKNIAADALLYYTTHITVMGINLNSQRVFTLAKNQSKAVGISSDNEHVYWTNIQSDSESIVRANLDGNKTEILLTSGLDSPEDLSVDWLTGNIYFTDNGMHHIAVCNSNGRYCTALITENVYKPRGIAVWPERGQMFWTDWGTTPMIARAAMDGSNSLPIVNESIQWPNDIALDTYNNRIYWVDSKRATIECIRPDGSDRRIILDGILKNPYSLAVFGDRLYWSDWSTKSIHSCHKFYGKDQKVLIRDRAIYSIHIYHSNRLKPKFHACLNASCSHLCLLRENNQFSCGCPHDMQLSKDKLNCITVQKRQKLFLGLHSNILEIEPSTFGRHNILSTYKLHINVHRMAYNNINETIFVADNFNHIMGEYDFKNDRFKTLIRHNLGNITDMAFDYLAYNLYWCDSDKRTIEIFSLQSGHRGIISIFYGYTTPLAIAIFPNDGILFVALRTLYHTYIDQLAMSGGNQYSFTLEDEVGDYGIRFAVDTEYNILYWSDIQLGRIAHSNYKTLNAHIVRNRLNAPDSLAVLGDDVIWSELGSYTIHWTNKNGRESIKTFNVTINENMYNINPILLKSIQLVSDTLPKISDHPCQHANGYCSHICLSVNKFMNSCLCPPGLIFKDNHNRTCIEMQDCEFRCSTGQCLTLSHKCNGHRDCTDNSDEANCPIAKVNTTVCYLDEFSCSNAIQCISRSQLCDGYKNCDDGSDEQQCDTFDEDNHKCFSKQYLCNNGKCVDLSTICDGYNDCGDNSDESNCSTLSYQPPCKSDMFQCASGTCIAKSWECDGKIDCTDSSDEHENCVVLQCPTDMYRCFLGQCIDRRLVCNSYNDCGDMSDEINCNLENTTNLAIPCRTDRMKNILQCNSNKSICLKASARCNGINECPLGEDEAYCDDTCANYEFTCKSNKECIRTEFRCDQKDDCSDGSDEENCQYNIDGNQTKVYWLHEQACGYKMYDCHNGRCVDESGVCDGLNDCGNGADEGGLCNRACQTPTGGPLCANKCQATPVGAICSCFIGYKLGSDHRSCIDIDECVEYEPCAQICHNTPGSYYCSCYPEFMLYHDKISCKSINNSKYLLLSSINEVRNITEEPLSIRIAWSANDSKIISFDMNVRLRVAYFITDTENAIYKINIGGSFIEQNLTIIQPKHVVVDWITGDNVYVITRSQTYEIQVCTFAINMCGTIIKAVPNSTIKTLTLDAYNGHLFFVMIYNNAYGQHNSRIGTSELDGTKPHFIFSKQNSYITALAYDPYKSILYYIDLHQKAVQGVNYADGSDGTSYVVIKRSEALIYPTDISWYENELFIINLAAKGVTHCQLYGYHICKFISLNILNMENIVIDGVTRQPLKSNPCLMAKCRGMCVQSKKGYVCMCNDSIVNETKLCSNALNSLHDISAVKQNHTKKILIILLLLLVLLILAGFACKYYQSRQIVRISNRQMHLQNPLVTFHRNKNRNSLGKQLLQETKTDNATTIEIVRRKFNSSAFS